MSADNSATGNLRKALAEGCAAVVAWAEVLDRINVFPVPDGDTGRNLVLSLAPFRDVAASDSTISERLLLSARGNSGNIACAFLRRVLDGAAEESLATRCVAGAATARKAVAVPQPGTMLTVLDALAEVARGEPTAKDVPGLLSRLAVVVQETMATQESLRKAAVVDSGALGMLVFLDSALRAYHGLSETGESLAASFRSLARFDRSQVEGCDEHGFCIDVVLRLPAGAPPPDARLDRIGSEVVALREGPLWKIHLHASDAQVARKALGELGEVVAWSWDDLHAQIAASPLVAAESDVHIVTDGAASLSRRAAEELGVTLLDSHIDLGERSLPESRLDPDDVYRAMRRGVRVSTAQASTHERHMHYERLAAQWKEVLYLCVGSVYTGNHGVATAWRASHPSGARLTVVDSGAASGRLAVVVRAAAIAARGGSGIAELTAFARSALERAEEYIFLECLEYLARGGRLSKAGAWFGDALGLAPVVSPFPDGARKVALLRKPEDRIKYACRRVKRAFATGSGRGYILAEYTDNRAWVESTLLPRLRECAPQAEIAAGPLSLTTGAHTGPGTWAVAMLVDVSAPILA
jgi:DegV family protein with EDD domain